VEDHEEVRSTCPVLQVISEPGTPEYEGIFGNGNNIVEGTIDGMQEEWEGRKITVFGM
jgi:hypothetical protein